MKANIIFVNQDNEAVERAKNLGMPEPKPIEERNEVYFSLEYISIAYLNNDGAMVIYLPSGSWLLVYDEQIWNKIKAHLMKR